MNVDTLVTVMLVSVIVIGVLFLLMLVVMWPMSYILQYPTLPNFTINSTVVVP